MRLVHTKARPLRHLLTSITLHIVLPYRLQSTTGFGMPLPQTQNSNDEAVAFLTFSPNSIPYAEVASYYHAREQEPTAPSLRVGLTYDILAPASLTIRDASQPNGKTIISGKSNIARFIARAFYGHAGSLSTKLSPALQAQTDVWLDAVKPDSKTPISIDKLIQTIDSQHGMLMDGVKDVTVADFMAWDFVKRTTATTPATANGVKKHAAYDKWLARVEEAPSTQKALHDIELALRGVNHLEIFRHAIASQISATLNLPISTIRPVIEVPADNRNGDFAVPIPRLQLPGNPVEICKKVAEKITPNEYILSCKPLGPFLNFVTNRTVLRDRVIPQVLELGSLYGRNASGFGKLAISEFSSPNIAKPFHLGHLRSTIIGNFIKNILEANGWATVSINYLGDWGKQYGVLAVGFDRYGSATKIKEDPIRHLFDVYVQINNDMGKDKEAPQYKEINEAARAYFKRMEDGDPSALAVWQQMRDLSIEAYKLAYGRLNIGFDVYSGESQYSLAEMNDVLKDLRAMGLLEVSQGAELVNLESYGHAKALITKSDGSMLYLSRDIAAAIDRYNYYHFDHMYYVVASQQDLHFKQLFTILSLMGKSWSKQCTHISFGMIKSKDGNMSTRKGTVVFLEDILNSVKDEMHDLMKANEVKYAQVENPERTADIVGQSAVMIQDMSARRNKDYEFNMDRMLAFEGDTGPYLQYAHSRLCSIERRSGLTIPAKFSLSNLENDKEMGPLIDMISQLPDAIIDASRNMEPSTIVTYLMKLSHTVSSALNELVVIGEKNKDTAIARLAVYKASRIALGNGMSVLGLLPLERM
ncbi:arginine---tRNA ligase [Synchytrium microbalum]|uniref:arginine--tRNA ligase n=1 Tax=Synchytrium microbalum TaxID=1806994 RepID=A0A507CEY3_9FUNG|nr:arginine---tRNA ligase [Synchytrium microbalum]TPX38182.1 arginine---tRNA ligase [Synchytrium microbalum]